MKKSSENNFWNTFAAKYDKFIAKYAKETYATSLQLIKKELSPNSNLLEIGTGTGLISFQINDKVKHITAFDYAPEMIKIANDKLKKTGAPNINFYVDSATNIKQPDLSFDIVIASNVFHLLPEPEKALKEIKRVLTNNGKMILPTYCHGQNMKTRLISSFMSLSGFKAENKWSHKEFKNFIIKEGFIIQKEEVIKDKIPLSFIVASKK